MYSLVSCIEHHASIIDRWADTCRTGHKMFSITHGGSGHHKECYGLKNFFHTWAQPGGYFLISALLGLWELFHNMWGETKNRFWYIYKPYCIRIRYLHLWCWITINNMLHKSQRLIQYSVSVKIIRQLKLGAGPSQVHPMRIGKTPHIFLSNLAATEAIDR